jgi:hypothetical protein
MMDAEVEKRIDVDFDDYTLTEQYVLKELLGVPTTIDEFLAGGEIIPWVDGVVFNPPYTIVNWSDGTKTIAKTMDGDKFIEDQGFAAALARKLMTRGEFKDYIEHASRQNYPTVVDTDSKVVSKEATTEVNITGM